MRTRRPPFPSSPPTKRGGKEKKKKEVNLPCVSFIARHYGA
jgi:hypothetical protein